MSEKCLYAQSSLGSRLVYGMNEAIRFLLQSLLHQIKSDVMDSQLAL